MDKLIKINNEHYIICNNDIINEGDWLLDMTDNTIWDCHKDMPNSLFPECKKITHSTQPLEYIEDKDEFGTHQVQGFDKIQYLPIQEIKELIGEVDVEKKSEIIAKSLHDKSKHDDWSIYDQLVHEDKELIKLGYNQALEDNKEKKYTEAQMRECWRASERFDRPYNEGYAPNFEEFIQSLQPKTEWEIELVNGKLKLL